MAEFHTLEDDVPGREVGLVVFGEAQFTAMMKADGSLDTLGIDAPRIAILWPEAAGIAPGLKDVMVATTNKNVEDKKRKKRQDVTDRL